IAAERKMERTRDNLLRVQDVLQELDRQMASLQRQAKRAEEYHRLKGALRELDLRVMAERRRTWTAEAADAGAELARLRKEGERDARGERRRATPPERMRRALAPDRARADRPACRGDGGRRSHHEPGGTAARARGEGDRSRDRSGDAS